MANIIHYSLIKCKRVIQKVLTAKLYDMAHGFDIRVVFKSKTGELLGSAVQLFLYIGSKSLYNCFINIGHHTRKGTDDKYDNFTSIIQVTKNH